ncbi:RHS repeat-associated core domain-containing protein [Vibrio sp. CyArs1]|uniref:RHS repeat-associated core domain-containing protein n=1 Tax=Vibrio sp. CyArs1 TaxID=2682577 RepID=UPI001F05A2D3|nr:RHS repeat-associated core domain-containing protein [Vibrio sp. CyArs1]
MKDDQKLPHLKAELLQDINASRRRFLKHSSMAVAASPLALSPTLSAASQVMQPGLSSSPLAVNPLGFNGERKDPATGLYHLGNGYRAYNPRLMRFHAMDSMSPFGKGGINSYAYCLGDPVNLRDPSGHVAISSLIIGAIVGAVVGAGVSAAAEGIQTAVSGDDFDWKQVGIGAALGFISGGFGAASIGAKTSVKVGLAVADAVVSGAADFGLSVATGASTKQAGINAGIGTVVGLATFGVGQGVGQLGKSLSAANQSITRVKTIGLSGRGMVGRRFSALYDYSLLDALDLEGGLKVSKTTGEKLVGFHGTSSASLAQGIEGGLNLGKMNTNGGLSGGKGFYFSVTPSIAKDFAEVATSEFGGTPTLLGVFTSTQQYQGMSIKGQLHIGKMGGGGMRVGHLSELEGIVRPGAYQAVRLRPLKWGYDGGVNRLPLSLDSPW